MSVLQKAVIGHNHITVETVPDLTRDGCYIAYRVTAKYGHNEFHHWETTFPTLTEANRVFDQLVKTAKHDQQIKEVSSSYSVK